MPGPYTTFTRANCDVPGPKPAVNHYYWPNLLCHLAVWRPSGSFQNAPVAVFAFDSEMGNDPGWHRMTDQGCFAPGSKSLELAKALSAAGWVIVSIEKPVTSYFRHQVLPDGAKGQARLYGSWKEMWPLALWPELPAYYALAVQYLKSNWCGIEGPDETIFGATLFGSGNSIDPENMIVVGSQFATTCWMYAMLQPSLYFPFERSIGHETMDRYVPRASHRVRGVVSLDTWFIEFTQFHVHANYNSPTPQYLQGNRMHAFMRAESTRRWSQVLDKRTVVDPAWKRQSAFWVLGEDHAENMGLSFFCEFTGLGSGTAAFDGNLNASDWNPGYVLSGDGPPPTNGKAWIMPDDARIQAAPWRQALAGYGGIDADPQAPIKKSVVLDAVPGSLYPVTSSATIGARVMDWLGSIAVPQQYLG